MKHDVIEDELWMYNFGDEEHWDEEACFDTEAETIEQGRIAAIDRGEDTYQVGQINMFKLYIDADDILEHVSEIAYDNCGEAAEDYLHYIPEEETKLLQEQLTEVFEKWLDETNNRPSFYTVSSISNHSLQDNL